MQPTIATIAAASWLDRCGLDAGGLRHWWVEIALTCESTSSELDLNIYPAEWGFMFRHAGRVSKVRVTDEIYVDGSDDHELRDELSDLSQLTQRLVTLENRYGLSFRRHAAAVRSNIQRAAPIVRAWLNLP